MLNKEQSQKSRDTITRGRWAGRGFQPQNLARGYFAGEELEEKLDILVEEIAEYKNNG